MLLAYINTYGLILFSLQAISSNSFSTWPIWYPHPPGHTGITRGACKSGYSRVLGGALECMKGCTSHNFPIIILSFLVLNIVLVIFIMFLNLTVTQGTLNGLLVYATVIQTHRTHFPDDTSGFGQVCWIFITSINLSFGSKLCLVKDLDGYQRMGAIFAQAI